MLVLGGCSEEADADVILYPDNGLTYGLAPNDMAQNDSVSANLSHGVVLYVHPKASYELSFDKGSALEAPKLQLFRLYETSDSTYGGYRVRKIEASEKDGRFVYSFTCEENDFSMWATSLDEDGDFYTGTTENARLTGKGAYSDHFSLNLIVVGRVQNTADSVGLQELASLILDAFRKFYTTVTVDTLYIRYASDHPTLGSKYPADEPWLAGKSSSDMFLQELGGWPEDGLKNALDIVYVHRIEKDDIMGYASLFSGEMGGGENSTVIVGNYVKSPKASKGEFHLTSREIVETILHETGHFFGLRHTTSTSADMKTYRDLSDFEDGLTDTPYCISLLASGLLKKSATEQPSDFVLPHAKFGREMQSSGFSVTDCPDVSNYMFPTSSDEAFEGFSDQQLDIIRKNLMIFPH